MYQRDKDKDAYVVIYFYPTREITYMLGCLVYTGQHRRCAILTDILRSHDHALTNKETWTITIDCSSFP